MSRLRRTDWLRQRRKGSVRLRVALAAGAVLLLGTTMTGSAGAALGGPVIIGGDDLTDHGFVDEAGNLQQGWLYLQRALENVAPKVLRPNAAKSVAALGSRASTSTSGDAGAAVGRAAAKAGLTVVYYDGESAINGFFAALSFGSTNPGIIWIAGTGASNDLDGSEQAALTANATAIADFVNSGGGLVSHGSAYGWLFALLPGLRDVSGGSSGDLYLTPTGIAAFPGVTASDVNAGPWHNWFEGNFGGLEALVRSAQVRDSTTGGDAAVVIGGASVTLPGAIVLTPSTATNPPGTSHTVTATVRDQAGTPKSGATVTFSVTSGPNAGAGGTAVTDANGQASFTYTSNGTAGTDVIEASFVDATQTTRRDTATKEWVSPPGDPSPPPPPPPPAESPPPPAADIGVTKGDSPDPVAVGSNLTYTLVVTNHGPGEAPDAAVSDWLPDGVSFVSVSTSRGSCALAGREVRCSFGTLAVNESVTVSLVVRVDQPGTITNTASVSTSVGDPNVGNNQVATAVTTAEGPPGAPASDPPPPPEEPGTFNARSTSGTVLINGRPIAGTFKLVSGDVVDARNGAIEIVSDSGRATFFGGAFKITQPNQRNAITRLELVGGDFSVCSARKTARLRTQHKPVRRLWGRGTGKFETKARYSAATVRGTTWLTEDQCGGSLTLSEEGTVSVYDFSLRSTRVLAAPGQYFAEPPPPPTPGNFVGEVEGQVLVNGVPVDQDTQIRSGDTIDVRSGSIKLTTTSGAATFHSGRFTVTQTGGSTAFTVLTLVGGDFSSCRKANRALSSRSQEPPKKVVRSLWGDGTGKFRTKSRFSSATVRGTNWLTIDRCDGSLTVVREGIVDVFDLTLERTVRVGAGERYLARGRTR